MRVAIGVGKNYGSSVASKPGLSGVRSATDLLDNLESACAYKIETIGIVISSGPGSHHGFPIDACIAQGISRLSKRPS
jgi:hypothetical protein